MVPATMTGPSEFGRICLITRRGRGRAERPRRFDEFLLAQ